MSAGPGHARGPNRTTYKVWEGLVARCTNQNAHDFDRYGGRGITVCDQWRKSFEVFLADMGPRPSRAHSIDRIDNDGPYVPGNCRWATSREQSRNRRTNRFFTINSERMCIADWAARMGVGSTLIHKRLAAGWDHERAILTPAGDLARGDRNPATKIDPETANEIRKLREIGVSIPDVAEWAAVSPTTIKNAMRRFRTEKAA